MQVQPIGHAIAGISSTFASRRSATKASTVLIGILAPPHLPSPSTSTSGLLSRDAAIRAVASGRARTRR